METSKASKKGLTVLGTFLLASFIFLGWVLNMNSGLKSRLNNETLREDSILSTKLLLDKEILGLNFEINSEKGKSNKLDSLLNVTSIELNEKLKTIAQLKKENLTVKSLKNELKQLKKMRDNLNHQMDELSADYRKLNSENKELKSQVRLLEEQLAVANTKKESQGFEAENFRIELQKKNPNKLTVKSKRTKNIELHLDLESVGQTGEQTFYVKIIDPDGYVVSPYITPVVIKDEKITYSISQKVIFDSPLKKTVINIKPTSKLKKKGVYKIVVYNEKDGMIGSSEVKTN